ncbi:uncharacterized protein LOC129570686 [Sitodiplosis mosellana]|uniref:uncharacterized protein LOC129570686 n=1 Tax=Sitodiplosis mosellana TaxID=263140 RepID=UPI0024452B00|nr:uncharacterized protein LOC129570686 [Sitodiplosis mosellana]
MPRTNEYGQAIGEAVPGWTARPWPVDVTLNGRTCRLEPLDPIKHSNDLFEAYLLAPDGRDWTYMFEERFIELEPFRKYIERIAKGSDPKYYAVIDLTTDKAVGILSYLRIDPANGSIEVGWITFSPLLKQTVQSTETHYLLMAYAFDELGYRRYEWKCDSLNAPSRKAAARLGFRFEGIFRNAVVYKERNRDTAWFSIIDTEWPTIKAAFQAWLKPENFDNQGKQIKTFVEFRGN